MKRIIGILGVIGLMCTGCANSDVNLRRETARFVGDVTPDEVAVSNVNRGVTNVDWAAATPKGNYKCSADDMLRRVFCVKRGKW